MRIRELFTVPEGKKVTEKMFARVLISSVCGILLCMACLAGTTWAWFAVSIENTGNEIQIATVTANVTITGTDITKASTGAEQNESVKPEDDVYKLAAGTYTIQIELINTAAGDSFGKPKGPVYVLMSATQEDIEHYYYFCFEGSKEKAEQKLNVNGQEATVSFSVHWIEPVSASAVGDAPIVIGTATQQESTNDSEHSAGDAGQTSAGPDEEGNNKTEEEETISSEKRTTELLA